MRRCHVTTGTRMFYALVVNRRTKSRVDSLPPAAWDQPLEFGLPDGRRGECRLRCYHTGEHGPLFVATQTRTSSGPGVTHAAEYLWPAIWWRFREPWPALFAEHLVGSPDHPANTAFGEHLDRLVFPLGVDGRPVVYRDPVTEHWRFGEPSWRRLRLSGVVALLSASHR
jgi:hypothetical protein